MPPPNPFIPSNLDVLPYNKNFTETEFLQNWDEGHLYYHKDNKFERPKGYVNMKFYTSDEGFDSPQDKIMFSRVWSLVLNEHMSETDYMAECAKLNCATLPTTNTQNLFF